MAALLVFVVVVAVYLQSLGGPFLWDDRLLILDAPLVERGGDLSDFLQAPFWAAGKLHGASTAYYRPLVTASFALDNALHHGNAGGYHLTNVVLHATNALLVYALVRKHGTRVPTAALLAVGWALLPRLAEAAAWISGRTDLLASLFTFAALLAWGPSMGQRSVAALFLGLGLLAKESAAAGALALAAGTWVAHAALPRKQRATRSLVELAPVGVVLAGYAALRVAMVGLAGEVEPLGALVRLRTVLEALGTYAAMLADPLRPRAVIGRLGATSPGALAAGLAIVVLLVALLRFRARVGARSATGLALALGALLPVLHVVPIPLLTLTADRFLYLPAAGLALAVAPALDRFLAARRARWAAAVGVAATLAVVTFGRVATWSDELEFWVQTYLETPKTNGAAATELGNVYYRAGLFEDGYLLSERALRYDDPNRANAAYNAAVCLTRLGRYDEARAHLAAVRGTGRAGRQVDLQRAILEIRAGRFDAARSLLVALERSGGDEARLLLVKLSDFEGARREYDRLTPASPPERLALLAELTGQETVATRAWAEAIERPEVVREAAKHGLEFLVQRGDAHALARAARAYKTRFGAIEPELAAMIGVHLGELERLARARARVGLLPPERTKKIGVFEP
ncbi:MAG TPA: CDC27 family protein [Polyangiaceae bacterium]